jgi:hypothetical protein
VTRCDAIQPVAGTGGAQTAHTVSRCPSGP